jgi:hypothetical protein
MRNCHKPQALSGPISKFIKLAVSAVFLLQAANPGPAAAEANDLTVSSNPYTSPYSLKFSQADLRASDSTPPRNDPRLQSGTAYADWYSPETEKRYGSWGPEPRHYPAPSTGAGSPSANWQRERILAVGQTLIGLPYQHHHIPQWDPPADWPQKDVSTNHQSKGLDCSNFTSWLYNYGLGIKLITNVHKQANEVELTGPGGQGAIQVQVINRPETYEKLLSVLVTGDLLYIRNKEGEISHVIVWTGDVGSSPDGSPLVMDCTDMARKDSSGTVIPVGVNLRPFTRESWYFKNFSHAHRIIAQ